LTPRKGIAKKKKRKIIYTTWSRNAIKRIRIKNAEKNLEKISMLFYEPLKQTCLFEILR
jgi:hypothetical protein